MKKLRSYHYWQAAIIAVCVASFFCILLPMQTYLANNDLFVCSIWEVLNESMPWATFLALICFVVLMVSEILIGRFVHVFLCALLVCGYLEVGFLSIGLPDLNAAPWVFNNPFRKIVDTAVLSLFATVIVSLYRWTKRVSHYATMVVVLLMISSLFDVQKKEVSSNGVLSDGFCHCYDVLKSFKYSPVTNVLVFVLDSTPASVTTRLMRDEPCLQAHFPEYGGNPDL